MERFTNLSKPFFNHKIWGCTSQNLPKAMIIGILFFSIFLCKETTHAQTLASWTGLTPSSTNATSKNANVATAVIGRSGITAGAGSSRYNCQGWTNASGHITITLTAQTGYLLNLNGASFTFDMGSSNTGPGGYIVQSSATGTTNLRTLTTGCGTSYSLNNFTLSNPSLNGLSSIVFRIYRSSATACNGSGIGGTGTGGPRTVTIGGSVVSASVAPTVTTTAIPTALSSISATLGGNVTATGGANISANGIVYSQFSVNNNPLIGGTGVTQLANPSPSTTTGAFSRPTGDVLLPNNRYAFKAYATNVSGTSYGAVSNFYTYANVPNAPTLGNATTSTLSLTIDPNSNPSTTEFSIFESVSGKYVQLNGTLDNTPVWQTAAQWSTINLTGLNPGTSYSFATKARNQDLIETTFSAFTNKSTIPLTIDAPVINTPTTTSLQISFSPGANASDVLYTIQESNSNEYVQLNGSLGAIAVWQTAAQWGSTTVSGLVPSKSYTFHVNSKNADNVETGFGVPSTKATLAAIALPPMANGVTTISVNLSIDESGNSSEAVYAIFESSTSGFVQMDGSIGGTPVWQTAAQWGVITIIDLYPSSMFTFHVISRNPDGIEASIGAGVDVFTLDIGTPFLSSTIPGDFGNICLNNNSTMQSFDITGEDLIDGLIEISSTGGFTFSTDVNGPFTTTLNIPQDGGSFFSTVYVIFNPSLEQSYNGNILLNGGGVTNFEIPVLGNGINTIPTVSNGIVNNITIQTAEVAGSIDDEGCSSVTSFGIEYSTTDGFVNGSGTQVAGSYTSPGMFSVGLTNLVPATAYYYKSFAVNNGGVAYSSIQSTFTTLTPVLSATDPTAFGDVCIGTQHGTNNTIEISGVNLSNDPIIVEASNGYLYSENDIDFFTTLSLPQPGGIFSKTIYVRFAPDVVQSYNGGITINGGGASAIQVSTSGTGVNTQASVTTGNASNITSVSADVSATITDIGCSDVTTYGIEYSINNGFINGSGISVNSTNLNAGSFNVLLENLAANTTYYYKAFATNAGGTFYANQLSFTTLALEVPVALPASNVLANSFTAHWEPVEGAISYRLDVSESPTFTGGTNATDLFFSEYIEGSSNNKYLEIFNGTGAPVNLSNYRLRLYSNGAASPTFNEALSGTIPNGGVVVLKNSSAALSLPSGVTAINNPAVNYNGDDAVELYRVSPAGTVDIFGRIGERPSPAWTAAGGYSTQDKTLVRISTVKNGITTNPSSGFPTLASEWNVFNQDVVSNLGSHTFNGVGPSFITGYNNKEVFDTSHVVTGLDVNKTYYYRVRAYSLNSTSGNSNVIEVSTCVVIPEITGNLAFCSGGFTTLNTIVAESYQWYINGQIISGATSQSIVVNEAGNYTVMVTTETGCSGTSMIATVEEVAFPSTPVLNITQPSCNEPNGSINIESPIGAGISYSLDAVNYQTNISFADLVPNTYLLYIKNIADCIITESFTILPQPSLSSAPVVSGVKNVCPFVGNGSTLVYSVVPDANVTSYVWSLPPHVTLVSGQGTASIEVSIASNFFGQANKQIKVYGVSDCGNTPTTIYYLLTQFPMAASAISGPSESCDFVGTGIEATYSVTDVVAATNYLWSTPAGATIVGGQGTTSIQVLFTNNFVTSNITVYALNDCGTSTPRSLTVTRTAPSTPGLISGPVNACMYLPTVANPTGIEAEYSIQPQPGVAYNWIVPAGVTIVGADATHSIKTSFDASFTGGSIQVFATTTCGTSNLRSLALSRLTPSSPTSIDVVELDVCPTRLIQYSISTAPLNTNWLQWTVPSGATIVSGQGTTAITVSYPLTAVSGEVSVVAQNGCDNSPARKLKVKLAACAIPENSKAYEFAKGDERNTNDADVTSLQLEVSVFPNPTSSFFKMLVISNNIHMKAKLKVVDQLGRVMEVHEVTPGETVQLGSKLKTGNYYVEVVQGQQRMVKRISKL